MRISELDYHLPKHLIATRPADRRDASRMLVCSRSDPSLLEHRHFSDLPAFLSRNDILVVNKSRVLPARIKGLRPETGGFIRGLFLEEVAPGVWQTLLHYNGRLRPGTTFQLVEQPDSPTQWSLRLLERQEEGWHVALFRQGQPDTTSAYEVLESVGETPLPPYILAARRDQGLEKDDPDDRERYQTVYAEKDSPGSVAAPTAGLHFTPELLRTLEDRGVGRTEVKLHVGYGTFKPVTADRLEDHDMHREHLEVPAAALEAIQQRRESGGRCICVGTTSVRALESVPEGATSHAGSTDLLIQPGFNFRWTEGLVTNFHLPRSTLLALVSALFPGEIRRLLEIYEEAIREEYRFFSYGDAMLILP